LQPKTLKLLEDIRDAAAFILEVLEGKSLDDYKTDRLLRQGVERNFEIIGEAVRRLAEADAHTAAKIGPYPQIIAFRNVLIHGYDLINMEEVWTVVKNHLPDLLKRVEEIEELLST